MARGRGGGAEHKKWGSGGAKAKRAHAWARRFLAFAHPTSDVMQDTTRDAALYLEAPSLCDAGRDRRQHRMLPAHPYHAGRPALGDPAVGCAARAADADARRLSLRPAAVDAIRAVVLEGAAWRSRHLDCDRPAGRGRGR